jgi:hypothetical protein
MEFDREENVIDTHKTLNDDPAHDLSSKKEGIAWTSLSTFIFFRQTRELAAILLAS